MPGCHRGQHVVLECGPARPRLNSSVWMSWLDGSSLPRPFRSLACGGAVAQRLRGRVMLPTTPMPMLQQCPPHAGGRTRVCPSAPAQRVRGCVVVPTTLLAMLSTTPPWPPAGPSLLQGGRRRVAISKNQHGAESLTRPRIAPVIPPGEPRGTPEQWRGEGGSGVVGVVTHFVLGVNDIVAVLAGLIAAAFARLGVGSLFG